MPEPTIPKVAGELVQLARDITRCARHAALSTLDAETGWPFASRVAFGTASDGQPILLISKLARHTTNLHADPRCSILIGNVTDGDPMAQARLTISGTARPASDDQIAMIRDRFLEHSPEASLYVDLPDFAFHLLAPDSVFLNAGFGRAADIVSSDLLSDG